MRTIVYASRQPDEDHKNVFFITRVNGCADFRWKNSRVSIKCSHARFADFRWWSVRWQRISRRSFDNVGWINEWAKDMLGSEWQERWTWEWAISRYRYRWVARSWMDSTRILHRNKDQSSHRTNSNKESIFGKRKSMTLRLQNRYFFVVFSRDQLDSPVPFVSPKIDVINPMATTLKNIGSIVLICTVLYAYVKLKDYRSIVECRSRTCQNGRSFVLASLSQAKDKRSSVSFVLSRLNHRSSWNTVDTAGRRRIYIIRVSNFEIVARKRGSVPPWAYWHVEYW